MLTVQQPSTLEYLSVPLRTAYCLSVHRLHDACCPSLVEPVCRMPHGAWCLFRVLILQGTTCGKGHLLALSRSPREHRRSYICDICKGKSSEGHCSGTFARWRCGICYYDVCFQCFPLAEDVASVEVRPRLLIRSTHDDLPETALNDTCIARAQSYASYENKGRT
jgi:hypothetical protein